MRTTFEPIASVRPIITTAQLSEFIASIAPEDFHAKRVLSLSNATLGVLHAGALTIHAIGRGLAVARGLDDKHTVKQVDRLLSNSGFDVERFCIEWVRYVVSGRPRIIVNMDWTDFDDDDQTAIVLSLQTDHGRSTPLLWKTVLKSELKGKRNAHEDAILTQLRDVLAPETRVTIVADRGFGDTKLFQFLGELGFHFVIRFKANMTVTSASGEARPAKGWLGSTGRMRVLRDATVTALECPVSTVVIVQDKGMKDTWCLAASDQTVSGAELKATYGRRFTIEEMFRDFKDPRFGMGMKLARIGKPERRDRLFLIVTIAHGLLTLLGAAGEDLGLDRVLKVNTTKKRTLSLFRQGLLWYERMLTMPAARLEKLISQFVERVATHAAFRFTLGKL
jgi:hypothetical protein